MTDQRNLGAKPCQWNPWVADAVYQCRDGQDGANICSSAGVSRAVFVVEMATDMCINIVTEIAIAIDIVIAIDIFISIC